MNGLMQSFSRLGAGRLGAIAGVGVAMVAFFVFLTTRLAKPGMSLLFADLDLKDSGQIVQKLEAMSVPYQLRGDGSQVLVPADQVARLRMAMAEQGLPRGGSIGYELFDKSDSFGASSFAQNVNQLRALEGELARTIGGLGPVQSARVHLVLPRRDLFARDNQEVSASIVLKLRGGERLGKGQVAAIRNLVASAVPTLKPTRVSVVDGAGTLLARGDGEDANAASGLGAEELRVNYETRIARSVEELLERTLGPGKTTTVAKLAARATMARRPVRVIAADTVRAGAIEQLAAVARILGISLVTAEGPGRLALAVASAAPEELILIDSFGVNPYNAADRREIAALIAAGNAEPMLVTAAGGDAIDTVEIARIFRDLGCSRMTVTRLDLTNRLGSVLAAADGTKLAFAEAGTAPEIAHGLAPFNPVVLARRLLAQVPIEQHLRLKKRGTS